MQENGLNKFRTVVSKVSSFVGNPVSLARKHYSFLGQKLAQLVGIAPVLALIYN